MTFEQKLKAVANAADPAIVKQFSDEFLALIKTYDPDKKNDAIHLHIMMAAIAVAGCCAVRVAFDNGMKNGENLVEWLDSMQGILIAGVKKEFVSGASKVALEALIKEPPRA